MPGPHLNTELVTIDVGVEKCVEEKAKPEDTRKQTPLKETLMIVTTFSVKNDNANLLAIKDVLKCTDIYLIQEYWLYNFQQGLLNNFSIDFASVARSVDECNPISPFQKPRGYGGVAFMWRKKKTYPSLFVFFNLPHGGCRILCIEAMTQPMLFFIGAHLPHTGRYKSTEQEQSECLDMIREIVLK